MSPARSVPGSAITGFGGTVIRPDQPGYDTARSGPVSVAWHDGGPLFPHPVEVHQHNDVIAGMHARLCALRVPGDRSSADGAA